MGEGRGLNLEKVDVNAGRGWNGAGNHRWEEIGIRRMNVFDS